MFYLWFGLLWLIICTPIFIIGFMVDQSFYILLFAIPFETIGIVFLVKGLKEYIRNKKTDIKGVECYGIITSHISTNVFINGEEQLKANIKLYIDSSNSVVEVSEVMDKNVNEYQIGTGVKVKYYNNDINFIETNIPFESLPYNAQYYLKEYINTIDKPKALNEAIIYENDNIIEVNGVKYKKMD